MAREFKKFQQEETTSKPFGVCIAYGCPMPASISNSVSGKTDSWACHNHFRAEPHQWQDVTKNLRENMDIVTLVNEIRLAQSGKPFDVRGRLASLKINGREKFLPNESDRRKDASLSMRLWLSRIEKLLFGISHQNLEHVGFQQETTNSDMVMMKVEEFMKKHKILDGEIS